MKTNYYSLIFSLLIFVLSLSQSVSMADEVIQRPELPQIHDIRDTLQLAKAQKLPILIMFGSEECPFCYLLREDFLVPMIISGDYVDKVIMREIYVSYGRKIIDFSGKTITTREFANRYKIRLFPTTVFLDSGGKPLVKNILGVTTPSLFGGTLDDTIDEALSIVKEKTIK
ncbi:MAG: thioredoxin fold domain-containing protein [Proteobacteria bacterium]|nr:thioredoxin fold domain-containing protein [Pseudomonadota bacterium]